MASLAMLNFQAPEGSFSMNALSISRYLGLNAVLQEGDAYPFRDGRKGATGGEFDQIGNQVIMVGFCLCKLVNNGYDHGGGDSPRGDGDFESRGRSIEIAELQSGLALPPGQGRRMRFFKRSSNWRAVSSFPRENISSAAFKTVIGVLD
jgi:hypothetical protein